MIICLIHNIGGHEETVSHIVVPKDFDFNKHKNDWEKWIQNIYNPSYKKWNASYSKMCKSGKYEEATKIKMDVEFMSLERWIINNANGREPTDNELTIIEYE